MRIIESLSDVIDLALEINVIVSVNSIEKSLLTNKLARVPTTTKPNSNNGWLRVFNNTDNIVILVANYENNSQMRFMMKHKFLCTTKKSMLLNSTNHHNLTIDFDELVKQFRIVSSNDCHDYLINKQINHSALVNDIYLSKYNQIVVSMYNLQNKKLCGLQYIDQKGTKKFHPGSMLKNSYHLITNNNLPGKAVDLTLVGEGFATVASAVFAVSTINPQLTVNGIVMFSSCNLTSFIHFIGDEDVYLLVDNDCSNQINVGVEAAMRIQKIMSHKPNFKLIIPSIHSGISCDINDYFCYYQNAYGNGCKMVNNLILSAY